VRALRRTHRARAPDLRHAHQLSWFKSTFSRSSGSQATATGGSASTEETFHSIFSSLLGAEGEMPPTNGVFHSIQTGESGSYCVETKILPARMLGALDLSSAAPGLCSEDTSLKGVWMKVGNDVNFTVENAFFELGPSTSPGRNRRTPRHP